ncbi:MAG: tRNA uridine-5-carboxymethylaminomethyl(34) synthesis GTPase MnmE, partial [Paludibacter sp.]
MQNITDIHSAPGIVGNTIAAISTAPGVGGIAVIRVSGSDAFNVADAVFRSANKLNPVSSQSANTVVFGTIEEAGELIDEVLVTVFRAPHSFTGENVVEIACHGSVYVQQKILMLLLSKGCRLAMPGEFTQRAFLNGKMDLSQAEAVADLIASSSAASHRMA